MELRQLQYFIKVARMQHVTHAAEELHVAQSAVSRQIHQLEAKLGVQLFVQKGRNLQLTPVGKLFLNRVEKIQGDLERAIQEVREFMDPEAGEVRLAFPHSLGLNLVPTIAAKFRKIRPNVKFHFKQGNYTSLLERVLEGVVDLALISPFPEDHEHVIGEMLLTEELVAVLPPEHALAECNSIQLKQLEDEEFALFSQGYTLRSLVQKACEKAGFEPKVGFEGEETDTIQGLVASGLGVSLLPEMSVRHVRSPLQPVIVKVSDPKVTRTIGLIQRKNEKLPLVADVFRAFLIEYFKTMLPGEEDEGSS